MDVESGWSQYFNLLIYIGIIPISLSKMGRVVSTKSDKSKYNKAVIFLCTINALLVCQGVFYGMAYSVYENYSLVALIYEYSQRICSGIFLQALLIWMWMSVGENFKTLQYVLESDKETKYCSLPNERNQTIRSFKILGCCLVFFPIDVIVQSFFIPHMKPIYFLQVIQYCGVFVYISTLLSLYTAIVLKLKTILQRINRRLDKFCWPFQDDFEAKLEILRLLRTRNGLLFIGFGNLSDIFGFVNLVSSCYMLIDLIQVWFFVVTLMDLQEIEITFWMLIVWVKNVAIWLFPNIAISMKVFYCNGINVEVSLFLFYFKGTFLRSLLS